MEHVIESRTRSTWRTEPALQQTPSATAIHTEVLLRGAAVLGLASIALIHLLDLPNQIQEVPYLGLAYLGLIAGYLATAALMIRSGSRPAWILAAALSAATLLGYVMSRTTGLPGDAADIGNWLEPLGLASMFVEGCTALLAVWALAEGLRTE